VRKVVILSATRGAGAASSQHIDRHLRVKADSPNYRGRRRGTAMRWEVQRLPAEVDRIVLCALSGPGRNYLPGPDGAGRVHPEGRYHPRRAAGNADPSIAPIGPRRAGAPEHGKTAGDRAESRQRRGVLPQWSAWRGAGNDRRPWARHRRARGRPTRTGLRRELWETLRKLRKRPALTCKTKLAMGGWRAAAHLAICARPRHLLMRHECGAGATAQPLQWHASHRTRSKRHEIVA
jgi:hypothetical protein